MYASDLWFGVLVREDEGRKMKSLNALLLPICLSFILVPVAAHSSGAGEAAILEIALAELEKRGLDSSKYRHEFHDSVTSVTVVFIDASVPEEETRQRLGNPGKEPALAVEIRRDDLRVIQSHFVR